MGGDALRKKLRERLSHAKYFGNGPLQSSGVGVRLVAVGRSGPHGKNLHNYSTPQNGRFVDIKVDWTHEAAQAAC